MMVDQCSNCFYSRVISGVTVCAKTAPNAISSGPRPHVTARWLEVSPDFWCGEYAPSDPHIYANGSTTVNVAAADPPVVNVAAPTVNVSSSPATVNVSATAPVVNVASSPATVNVSATAPTVNVPAQTINVSAPTVNVAAADSPVINIAAPVNFSPTINAVAAPPQMVTGIATVDFGSSPSSQATVLVDSQDIGAYSFAQAVINSRSTADNNTIQHEMAGVFMRAIIQDIVPGVSFTIGCACLAGRATGKFKVDWAWRAL